MTKLLHISDIHAVATGLLYERVDAFARLRWIGEYVQHSGLDLAGIIVTGDLVQRGEAAAYPQVAAALAELTAKTGSPVLTVLGNHDDPQAAAALPGHSDGNYRSHWIGDMRILLLDSSSGNLGAEQLSWLREQLTQRAPGGSIVALHHPPLPSPMPLLQKARLGDARDLKRILRGSCVRMILCGHYHHATSGILAGIPVLVAPALAYQQHHLAPAGFAAGLDISAFNVIHLGKTTWASGWPDAARSGARWQVSGKWHATQVHLPPPLTSGEQLFHSLSSK